MVRPLVEAAGRRLQRLRETAALWWDRPPRAAPSLRYPRWVAPLVVGLTGLVVLSARLGAVGPVLEGEVASVYLASRLPTLDGWGEVPVSRTPLHLWLLAPVARLAGTRAWEASQLLAIAGFFGAAVLVGLAARRFGRAAVTLSVLAMLLGWEPLLVSALPSGETLALPLVAAGLFALSRERLRLAGLLWGTAGALSPLALPPALVFSAIASRRSLGPLGATFGLLSLASVALHGGGAIVQPLTLGLAPTSLGAWARLAGVLAGSAGWLVLVVGAPILSGRDRRLAVGLAGAGMLPLLLVLASAHFNRSAVVPAWPFAALAAGLCARELARRWAFWSTSGEHARTGRVALAVGCAAVLLGIVGDRLGRSPGDPVPGRRYEASASPAGALARGLFWRERTGPSDHPLLLTRLLWADAARRAVLEPLAQAVLSQSQPGETIFGDAEIAPWVALRTGRRLALDLADPHAGRLPPERLATLAGAVEEASPRLVLSRKGRGLPSTASFAPGLREAYTPRGTFSSGGGGFVYLHVRRPGR